MMDDREELHNINKMLREILHFYEMYFIITILLIKRNDKAFGHNNYYLKTTDKL